MKKNLVAILALCSFLALAGCSALQKAAVEAGGNSGSSGGPLSPLLPSPNALAASLNNDFSLALQWGIPAFLASQNISVAGFYVKMQPPTNASAYLDLVPYQLSQAQRSPFAATTFFYTVPPLDHGFGDYNFVIRTYDPQTNVSAPSKIFTFHFRGYMDIDTVWSSFGNLGQVTMSNPTSVAVAPNGDVFIADTGNDRIIQINSATAVVKNIFGQHGSGVGQFFSPRGLAFDAQGKLYVADSQNSRIVIFNPTSTSTFLSTFETINTPSGTVLTFPIDCTIDTSGALYVADVDAHQVEKITFIPNSPATGDARVAAVSLVGNAINFQAPYSVKCSATNTLFILDKATSTVYAFDAGNGTLTTQWAVDSTASGSDFHSAPTGLAIDNTHGPNNNGTAPLLFVSNGGMRHIQVFSAAATGLGTFVAWWGMPGADPGEFDATDGQKAIAFGNLRLYVADGLNNRIQSFKY